MEDLVATAIMHIEECEHRLAFSARRMVSQSVIEKEVISRLKEIKEILKKSLNKN